MRSYSPESIQFAEENKMKALFALSQIISSHMAGARDELLCARRKLRLSFGEALAGKKGRNFISFPLKHFLCKISLHCVPIVSSSIFPFEAAKKMRVFVGKIIYVPRTTPVALRRYMNKDYSGEIISSVLNIFFSRQTLSILPKRLLNFLPGGKTRRQTFLKSKPKTRKNFSFICFLFSLICVWFLRWIYWFIIFGCTVFRLRFRFDFKKTSFFRFPLKWFVLSAGEGSLAVNNCTELRDLWSGKASATLRGR